MKKAITVVCIILLARSFGYSQTSSAPANQNSKADSVAIEKTANNYVEGFFNGDATRVGSAVHPELVKRIIYKDNTGNAMIQNMGASGLIFAAIKHKKADPNPSEPFKATVTIYDIFNETATVKIVTNKFDFIDYAQMAKIGGEWKIVNVLWANTR